MMKERDDCKCEELVRDTNAGYLVNYGDIKELKEKMKWAIENPEDGMEMVETIENIYEKVKNKSWEGAN